MNLVATTFNKVFNKLIEKGFIKYRATIFFDSGRCLTASLRKSELEDVISCLKDRVLKGEDYRVTYGKIGPKRGFQIDISTVSHITYRVSILGF